MKGFFDILKKNGALKFFDRVHCPELVVHDLGNGAQIADLGRDLNSSTWHKVKIQRNQTQTYIELDNKIKSVLPDSSKIRPVVFNNANYRTNSQGHKLNKPHNSRMSSVEFGGNFSANSFVYVGGLPSFYSTKLSSLALPSAVFEPRFRGSIRNIVYADDESGRPRRQEVMAYKVSSLLFCKMSFTNMHTVTDLL